MEGISAARARVVEVLEEGQIVAVIIRPDFSGWFRHEPGSPLKEAIVQNIYS